MKLGADRFFYNARVKETRDLPQLFCCLSCSSSTTTSSSSSGCRLVIIIISIVILDMGLLAWIE